jgi:hypothetical protein
MFDFFIDPLIPVFPPAERGEEPKPPSKREDGICPCDTRETDLPSEAPAGMMDTDIEVRRVGMQTESGAYDEEYGV